MKLFGAIELALARTGVALFKPFNIGNWFSLGFSAWLAGFVAFAIGTMGFDAVNYTSNMGILRESFSSGQVFILGVYALVILGVVGLFALLAWLGCRGQFLLVDNVVRNRADVVEPWTRLGRVANDMFRLHLYVICFLAVLVYLLLTCVVILTWPAISSTRELVTRDYMPLIIGGGVYVLLIWLPAAIMLFFIREFGVLWVYKNGGSAWDAAKAVGQLASRRPVDFILYALMRVVMGLAFGAISVIAALITCCIGALPYLRSVITLPIEVFRVHFSIECFSALSPECDLRSLLVQPPPAPPTLPPSLPAGGL